jgi:hypothetical protein
MFVKGCFDIPDSVVPAFHNGALLADLQNATVTGGFQ